MSDFSQNSHQHDYDEMSQALDGNQLLPLSLRQFLFNRVFEVVGILTLIMVIFAAVAIATWSPLDPSLNHATSDIAQNSLGLTGAYLSDFLIQTFGIAVVFLLIPIILMGWNLTRHQMIKRPILRLGAWVLGGCFLAGALSALPKLAIWPLNTGLGGISGDVTLTILSDLFGSSVHIAARSLAALLLTILGVGLGLYACGLRFKEMLSTLTFLNETSIDSGVNFVKKAKSGSTLLGVKSLSIANYINNLKTRNKEPFSADKKPWKTADTNMPLDYENLTHKAVDMNENEPTNAPKFIAKNAIDMHGDRKKRYNPLKAKTGQLFNKLISGFGHKKQTSDQHIEPQFNPHAFEPISHAPNKTNNSHIPALNQELKEHYQAHQHDQHDQHGQINNRADAYYINSEPRLSGNAGFNAGPNLQNEVVGSSDMGDFYDGPNSYEDYWFDSVSTQTQQMPIQSVPSPQHHQAMPQAFDVQPMPPYDDAPSFGDMPSFDNTPVYDNAPSFVQTSPHGNAPVQSADNHYLKSPEQYQNPAFEQNAAPIAHPMFNSQAGSNSQAGFNPQTGVQAPPLVATQTPAPATPPSTPEQAALQAANCNSTAQNSQPFDLSAPQVSVRKGRNVAKGKNARHIGPQDYELPSVDLLAMPEVKHNNAHLSEKFLAANARILENVLAEFRISGEIMNVRPGPVVTLYELEPAPGVKSARVIGLADDIARSMSAISARIAVIPGRNVIGIELPNERRDMVYLNEIISTPDFDNDKFKLPMALGKSIDGSPVVVDLARMPHLLIAGTTGSGKSVGINSMILSILYKMTPDKCKLIMVDPKMLELSIYDGIPHLLTPVVTDPKKAVVALKWSVREMESRYKKMSKLGVRNIEAYNQRIKAAEDKGEPLMRTMQTGFDHETGQPVYEHEALDYKEMPFIVIVIDEMADLMMVAGKEIETVIQRLAQMARAAGIHMITATQRPSVDVITGSIKANFPTRISFQVTSKIDSRTILNEMGAEQLLGQGDMLYMAGGGRISRVHGAFVSDEEVESVVNHLKRQGVPQYIDEITVCLEEDEGDATSGGPVPTTDANGAELDLYDQAVAIVARDKKASTSYIQRKLSIGYNRAATIIERMEDEGVIGPANHAGKRDILVGDVSEFGS